jgi:hypothetical protein
MRCFVGCFVVVVGWDDDEEKVVCLRGKRVDIERPSGERGFEEMLAL